MTGFNLTKCLERNADRTPDAPAVLVGGDVTTHAQLNDRVYALTAGWRASGVRPGAIVGVLMNNGPEFLDTTFSLNGAGAIFLPLNTRLALPEWAYILGHAGAEGIVVGPEFEGSVQALRRECPNLRLVVSTGSATAGDRGVDTSLIDLAAGNADRRAPYEFRSADDVSRLMYTSGTTARPKGVPITYGNTLWKIFDHMVELDLASTDRTLLAGPMYHVGAFDLPGIGTLHAGGSVAILPKFDVDGLVDALVRHSITNVWLAPSMLNALLQLHGLDALDLSRLRLMIFGGEKMPPVLLERFGTLFPHVWLADAFGMTETVSGDTFLGRDYTISKIGSVGKPVMHLEAKVVDFDGTELGPDQAGELLLRGPKVFRGYWKDEEATARAFSDGWFHTGDIAHLDADGFLYIDDRIKDMIISGGENIATPEIERVLYEHPAVLEVAVVGVPDERWGQVPKAYVVLKPDADVTFDELVEHSRSRLAKFKVPAHIEFRPALPRTPSGKVLKRELR